MAGFVIAGRHITLSQGHTDAIGKSLTQRAGGGFNTRRNAIFGMTGCFAAPLTKIF